MPRFAGLCLLLLGGIGTVCFASPALAQEEDNSRAVRIIEEAPGASAPPAASPPAAPTPSPAVPPAATLQPPAAPVLQPPATAQPSPPPPQLRPPAPQQPALHQPPPVPTLLAPAEPPPTPTVAPAPPSSPGTSQAALGVAPPPDLGAVQASLKGRNAAGVTLEILPRTELQVGEKIALRVATRKQGYLLLVDVDSSGKLTQIYPNRRSLLLAEGSQETANLVKPGRPVTIPEIGDPYAGFEFVASPPAGVAMIVAILSDRPVQMLDLPDIPPSLIGQGGAISYLTDWTSNLRIASAGATDQLQQANWSFDAKLYRIR